MLVVSVNLDTAMVTDDYSKEGRGINMAIARDQKASEMEISGTLQLANRKATLTLATKDGPADFPYLVLHLYHPTLEGKDSVIQFNRLADGEYSGRILEDLEGRRYYDVQGPDNDWRVKGELWLPAEHPITIQAKASAKE